MTITMPDSIVPANMPKGYKAYLAYVDGARSKDADQVRAMFAGAEILTLTVLGGTALADGCDCEPGDLSPESTAAWVKWRIGLQPGFRPVVYASRDALPDVIAALLQLGIVRAQYRILSAHYGWKVGSASAHICGPSTCGTAFQADGTQWTSTFPGIAGEDIDMSLLDDEFFGAAAPAVPTWQETAMQNLPVDVKQGATGDVVRTIQSLCIARHQGALLGTSGDRKDGVDGVFGAATTAAVKAVQKAAGFTAAQQDGEVGPLTWPPLFGV